MVVVFGLLTHPSAAQVSGDLAGAPVQHRADVRLGAGLLPQEHLPHDCVDIRVGQLPGDGEAVLEPDKRRRLCGERRLTRRHKHDAATELRLQSFHDLDDDCGPSAVLADVLLDLVKHQERQRHRSVGAEGLPCRVGELLRANVSGELGELATQDTANAPFVLGEIRVGAEDRASNVRTDVEIVQFMKPIPAGRLDLASHGVEPSPLPEPEAEHRLRILRGQVHAAQHDAQHVLAHPPCGPTQQRPSGGNGREPGAARLCVEFAQKRLDFVGESAANERPRRRAVGERRVDPQVGQHLQKMRLAASEEPTHPCGVLLRVAQVAEKALQDGLRRPRKLTLADKGLEFRLEFQPRLIVHLVRNASLAVVRKASRARVAIEYLV